MTFIPKSFFSICFAVNKMRFYFFIDRFVLSINSLKDNLFIK